MPEVASAFVSLIPSARGFAAGVTKETDRAASTAGKRFGGIFSGSLKSVIGGALAGIGVTKLVGDALGEAREAQKVGALTANVIKTTGGAANVSAKQVGDLATAISNKVGIDDEAIQSGANLLLTFKNVRNEVGKGNAIFNRATKAAVDLSASGFGDLTGTSKQLGKALNDPIKGITALARSGVTFTEQQKEQIKTLVESGDVLKAQKIILKEVESQVGGSAKAQATASDKARVAIGNLEEQIGTALLPVVDDLANRVSKDVVPAISEFITEMQDGTGAGGEVVDVLTDLVDVGKGVLDFFNGLPGPVKKFGAEGAIALVVLTKVNGILGPLRTSFANLGTTMGATQGQMGATTSRSAALGGALRNLAGAGGMLAIMEGTKQSNKALGTLETTLGAAALGFAVGGPVGAGLGTGIGLFLSLKGAISGTNDVKMPSPKQLGITDIIGALDEADAAATKFNRNQIFDFLNGKTEGAPPTGVAVGTTISATAKLYGIPDRQIVQAMTGNVKAFEAIKARFAKAAKNDPLGVVPTDRDAVVGSIRTTLNAYRAEQEQVLKNIAATTDYGHKLDALPDKKQTKVEATGIIPTVKGIAQVAAKIKATPEEIQTLISAAGVKTTVGAVQSVINKGNEWKRLHPTTAVDANTEPARVKLRGLIGDLLTLTNQVWNIQTTTSGSTPKFRAGGGPVVAGQPYIVGERRAELFVPDQNGRIIPRVPTIASSPASSGVETEQTYYRAFSRALSDSGTVIMRRDSFDALDLVAIG